jgi:hypothetical protein
MTKPTPPPPLVYSQKVHATWMDINIFFRCCGLPHGISCNPTPNTFPLKGTASVISTDFSGLAYRLTCSSCSRPPENLKDVVMWVSHVVPPPSVKGCSLNMRRNYFISATHTPAGCTMAGVWQRRATQSELCRQVGETAETLQQLLLQTCPMT